jgi:hypothetical protein
MYRVKGLSEKAKDVRMGTTSSLSKDQTLELVDLVCPLSPVVESLRPLADDPSK